MKMRALKRLKQTPRLRPAFLVASKRQRARRVGEMLATMIHPIFDLHFEMADAVLDGVSVAFSRQQFVEAPAP